MVPIMFDTTSAVALTTPSCLRREGLPGAATLLFYRAYFVLPGPLGGASFSLQRRLQPPSYRTAIRKYADFAGSLRVVWRQTLPAILYCVSPPAKTSVCPVAQPESPEAKNIAAV